MINCTTKEVLDFKELTKELLDDFFFFFFPFSFFLFLSLFPSPLSFSLLGNFHRHFVNPRKY